MSPRIRKDKRLRPAKVIGIILFVSSIVIFSVSLIYGLLLWIAVPQMLASLQEEGLWLGPAGWVLEHYGWCLLGWLLFWVPLSFASRALFKYRTWGRIVTIIWLILFMLLILLIGYTIWDLEVVAKPLRFARLFELSFPFAAVIAVLCLIATKKLKTALKDHQKPIPTLHVSEETDPVQ